MINKTNELKMRESKIDHEFKTSDSKIEQSKKVPKN